MKVLAARYDSGQNFMWLGSRQNKDYMGRRLFQRLKQSIRSRVRKHMNLINDISFITATARDIIYFFPERADIVNAPVAGSVYLDHVHKPTLVYGATYFALVTGFTILRIKTVNSLDQDTPGAGFPRSPRARKEVGMCQLLFFHGTAQSTGHHLLPHHLR